MNDLHAATEAILAVGQRLDARGWAPASAGNYSMRLADGAVAITVSGAHKGRMTSAQVMRVDAAGVALEAKRPSAESLLHALVYAIDPSAGAVLHTHSVAGTVFSRAQAGMREIRLAGYELLKIFPGIATHDTMIALPLVDNLQDMAALAEQMHAILAAQAPLIPAFYIRGHGLYAWGPTMVAAELLAEGCEFLLACAWEEWKAQGRRP
jgi:methylthioribulose-1-phosphate dehydratase